MWSWGLISSCLCMFTSVNSHYLCALSKTHEEAPGFKITRVCGDSLAESILLQGISD